MKLYKWANFAMLGIAVAMLVMTIVMSVQSNQEIRDADGVLRNIFTDYSSVITVFILAAYVIVQIICIFTFKPGLSFYKLGFYVLHIGLVLFLAGSFVYYLGGDIVDMQIPVDRSDDAITYNSKTVAVPEPKDGELPYEVIQLGISIGVSGMDVDYYTAEELGTDTKGLDSDAIQVANNSVVKHYDATIKLYNDKTKVFDEVSLTVNNPIRNGGWRIYLMSYSKADDSVVLMLKKDPGEFMEFAGVWFIIAGTFMMCIFRKFKSTPDTADEKTTREALQNKNGKKNSGKKRVGGAK